MGVFWSGGLENVVRRLTRPTSGEAACVEAATTKTITNVADFIVNINKKQENPTRGAFLEQPLGLCGASVWRASGVGMSSGVWDWVGKWVQWGWDGC